MIIINTFNYLLIRILVLSDGKIIEYDTPINLVNNKESEFYSYYNQHHLK